jgi:4,5-DOPA dioxygenase extradiol
VLVHAFPEADIPVVQLSINAQQPFDHHLELAARLAPLRDRGVLVLGSGNVVHNLRMIDWGRPEHGFDWAHAFDDDARALMESSPEQLARLQDHAAFTRAVPTPDHFIPLLYLAGLASAAGHPARALLDGYAMGSLSMTAYTLDADVDSGAVDEEEGEPAGPDGPPAVPTAPPDESNI